MGLFAKGGRIPNHLNAILSHLKNSGVSMHDISDLTSIIDSKDKKIENLHKALTRKDEKIKFQKIEITNLLEQKKAKKKRTVAQYEYKNFEGKWIMSQSFYESKRAFRAKHGDIDCRKLKYTEVET